MCIAQCICTWQCCLLALEELLRWSRVCRTRTLWRLHHEKGLVQPGFWLCWSLRAVRVSKEIWPLLFFLETVPWWVSSLAGGSGSWWWIMEQHTSDFTHNIFHWSCFGACPCHAALTKEHCVGHVTPITPEVFFHGAIFDKCFCFDSRSILTECQLKDDFSVMSFCFFFFF